MISFVFWVDSVREVVEPAEKLGTTGTLRAGKLAPLSIKNNAKKRFIWDDLDDYFYG